ncbi:toxin VasX [Marinomonas mediterranea]|jgi:hypothetical protein|uniref:Uncharacterized protein n=1 Tax=Marinomonas mediterranea (strain ATCC 700492 / JCM 21426 / NBRC 103028 / MMB-1) TaxID=717774 RepID=F2K293_MARM1|nr:toxin VasX [Marinomonas mediterranea]ADZ92273.1 hypothetical protein Marme_3054 [Marinomonas mediterranea MMB-1]
MVQSLALASSGKVTEDPRLREMVMENVTEGEKKLSLIFRDDKHGHNKIPLYRGIPVPKEEPQETQQVALVPAYFAFRDYDTIDPEREQYNRPLRDGWLYIYLNGYLWRELQVVSEGQTGCHYRDVNLAYERRSYPRAATGEVCREVVLPARINDEDAVVQVGFSEQQWSWERIDQLGGMNDEDPRQNYPNEGRERAVTSYSDEFCEKQRTQRLTLLEHLSAYRMHFEGLDESSPIRLRESEEFDPEYRKHILLQLQQSVPFVVIEDAIGQARYYAEAQSEMIDLLSSLVKTMTNAELPADAHPLHRKNADELRQKVADCRLATLLNQHYFAPIDQQLQRDDLSEDEREALDKRVEERELLDKNLMQDTLNAQACDDIIFKALEYRRALIEVLDSPKLLAALHDFHSLERAHWFCLLHLMSDLIERLSQPVALAYKDLFLDLDDYALHLENDLGVEFIRRLTGTHLTLEPHPIKSLLFPKLKGDQDDPLAIDMTTPAPDALQFDPNKSQTTMAGLKGGEYLNWPPIKVNGRTVNMQEFVSQALARFTLSLATVPPLPEQAHPAESTMLQAWRFMGHAVHAYGARVSEKAHANVSSIQNAEIEIGSSKEKIAEEKAKRSGNQKRFEELSQKQGELNKKINEAKKSLKDSQNNLADAQSYRKQNLEGYGSIEKLKNANIVAYSRVLVLDEQIALLAEEQTGLRREISHTQQKQQQVNNALKNVDTQIQALKQSKGVLSASTLKSVRNLKKHNASVASLYALMAGDQLEVLHISHNDLLADRIPDGLMPMSMPGRLKRLEEMLDIAKRFKNHKGEWANVEIDANRQVRVPVDLAINDMDRLQQYLAYITHSQLDDVVKDSQSRVKQVALKMGAISDERAKVSDEIAENEKRAKRIENNEKRLAEIEKQITRDKQGVYHLGAMSSGNGKVLTETQNLIDKSSNKILELEGTIEKYQGILDQGHLQRHFKGRMNTLMYLNGGMMVFESYNLSSAAESFIDDRSYRKFIDFGSALIDFAATLFSAIQYVHEAKYGTAKQIKKRLYGSQADTQKFVKTLAVDEKILSRSVRIQTFSIGFNAASGVLSAIISGIDGYNRWLVGDKDAAMAYGLTSIGFVMTAAAALPMLASMALTLNIAGFLLIAGGFVMVYLFTDTPAESLLKNSPFGIDPEARFSSGGEGWTLPFGLTERPFLNWKQNREQAYHEILSFFYAPRIQFKGEWLIDKEYCEFTISTPALSNKGRYHLEIQIQPANMETWVLLAMINGATNNTLEATNSDWIRLEVDGAHHRIRLHKKLLLTFEQHTHNYGWFSPAIASEWHLRLRIKTFPNGPQATLFPGAKTHYMLPAPERDEQGRALIDDNPVSDAEAMEHSWVTMEKSVVNKFEGLGWSQG